jgi:YNFM family putative membrane transporter
MLAGFCAFLQLYATQPILPLLADVFRAGKVAVSLTVTAAGIGVAIGAPIVGYLADRMGRRRLIIWSTFLLAASTLLTATSVSLSTLILWRFLQGLVTPGVFAVTVAYVNDEWADGGASGVMSTYISGTVMGGFLSRMISGLVAAHWPWRWVFVVLGGLGALCAWGVAIWLPPERRFRAANVHRGSWREAVAVHLRNRQLFAACLVGFCVLFSLVSAFTYITFYLAEAPFFLRPAELGSIFAVYLVGAAVTPLSAKAIERYGNRRALAGAIAAAITGVALTLGQSLWVVALGLAITCSGVFLAQTSASNFVGLAAKGHRALAAGLYASFYHTGGSLGAAVPGYFWSLGGWPACVAFIASVQLLTVLLALAFWQDRPQAVPGGLYPQELD